MKVLITGGSSGIGKSFVKKFIELSYDVIVVSSDSSKLNKLKEDFNDKISVACYDICNIDDCYSVFNEYKDVDIFINNAGRGVYGNFIDTDLSSEVDMIKLNVVGNHVLFKLFLKEFVSRNHGYILNVSSIAGFLSGPLMSSYYASKNYVLKLSYAVREELKHNKNNVYIGVLCPGPVKTNFDKVCGINKSLDGLDSDYVANYTIKKMFKRKFLIIPGFKIKMLYLFYRFIPEKFMCKLVYLSQSRKKV